MRLFAITQSGLVIFKIHFFFAYELAQIRIPRAFMQLLSYMIFDFTLVVLLGFIGGLLAKAINQPTVVGYLVAGIIGSFFFGSSFQNREAIDAIAQIGVSLLLFTLGIELSFRRFRYVLNISIIGGIAQILISIVIYKLILLLFPFEPYESLIIAAAFSLSSTAVVVKILNEKGLVETLAGDIMVAWLLVQDLAVVPLLIVLPFLKNGLNGVLFGALLVPCIKIGLLFLTVIYIGRKAASVILTKIALFNSRELIILTSLSLCFLTAFLTQALGLSFVLGAFLAGVLIADTTEQHLAFAEIRPLRDLFSVIFFVSLALLIPREYLFANIPTVLLLSVIVILVKFLVVGAIVVYFGYHSKISFLVAVGLVQVGEFAFVLAREAFGSGVISASTYSLVLGVSICTIMATPVLFQAAPYLYAKLRYAVKQYIPTMYLYLFARFDREQAMEELPYADHVIICGFGRMGKYVGRALESARIPYVVIEINRFLVAKLRLEGIPVVYGDPTDSSILDYAQVDKARLLVVAVPDLFSQQQIITNAKSLKPTIKIISRAHFEEYQKLLKTLGADVVVQPEFEAAITVIAKALSLFGLTKEEIGGKISRLKIAHGLN